MHIKGLNGKKRQITLCLLLVATSLILYWPVIGYDFIALDDNIYVVENHHIQNGLNPTEIVWALTSLDTTNWHPLTWLSLMMDYELYDLTPAGYHVTNLLLHILNVILLFLLLQWLTGKDSQSALVAALFAVHPMNIESVVWISERKNLLSTLFWMLTIMSYLRYVKKPGWGRYWKVLVCFTVGLMAKPTLVTLPVVLLLLDYWPLQRFPLSVANTLNDSPACPKRRQIMNHLLLEKVPLVLVSLLSAWITFYAARAGGAVKAISVFPMIGRIENAFIAYAMYLVKMFWPVDLAIFYPYPPVRPVWQIIVSVLFLTVVTGLVCLKGHKYRYLITGWLWYGITLFPVIGIVQVGFQAMANRYAYISLIGIFIIVIWGVSDLMKAFPVRRYIPAVSVMVILAFIFCTKSALPDWKNSEAVFRHAINVTRNNHIAEAGLGNVWLGRGDLTKAHYHFLESLRIRPDHTAAMNNLGIVYMKQGLFEDAIVLLGKALEDNPTDVKILNSIGVALASTGRYEEAIVRFREALRCSPDYQEARDNLTKVMMELKGSVVP